MKLKLKNFKKYHDKEIFLPDKGLILLSGDSGAGKSSIIKAILYALYGQVKSPYSFGTSTCSVTLEYSNLNICRTSSPNTLQVVTEKGELFEKTAAQGVIDDRIKQDYRKFMLASYIPQKNNSSILSLTPTEQLSLIQVLSFSNEEKNKEVLKRMIKEKHDILEEQRSRTEYLQQTFDKQAQGFQTIEFPLVIKNSEEETIEKYKKKLANFTEQVIELNRNKNEINVKIQNNINMENKLKLKNEKLDVYKPLLEEKCKELGTIKVKINKIPDNISQDLEKIKNNIDYNNLLIKLKELEEEYNEIKEQVKEGEQELSEIWPDKTEKEAVENLEYLEEVYTSYQNLKDINKKLKVHLNIKEMKKYIKKEIIELNVKIKNAIEKKVLYEQQKKDAKEVKECPECGAYLKLELGVLIKHDDITIDLNNIEKLIEKNSVSIKEMENRMLLLNECDPLIKNVSDDIEEFDTLAPGEIEELKNYIKENKNVEDNINKNLNVSRTNLKKSEEKILKLKTNIELKKVINPKTNEELNKKYSELENLVSQTKSLKKDHETINRKCLELEKNINDLNKEIEKLNNELAHTTNFDKKLNDINDKILEIEQEYKEYKELEPLVEEYIIYKNKENNLVTIQEELDQEYEKLKILDLEYSGYVKLKERYIKAEIISLNITLDNINQHTEYFLDKFFSASKLTAVLNINTGIKNTESLKIETSITFLGNEYDKISELSGGEFDRCTLASICGINTMLGSPILILDESLSSLNSEINTDIISFLKELANNKLIIVCSHEAVRGIFDEIIEIY